MKTKTYSAPLNEHLKIEGNLDYCPQKFGKTENDLAIEILAYKAKKRKRAKVGRKPLPADKKKVRLQGSGPFVSPETERILEHWRTCYGVTCGQAIDSLMRFAREHPHEFFLDRGKMPVIYKQELDTTDANRA